MTPDESMQTAATLPAGQDIFCPGCGYNVRGLTENRCPECGRAFDPAVLAVSQLPWPQRHAIGRFRAYWRTVFFVMFRNRQFCNEFVHPVSYKDSQRFRWWCILHAWLPVAILCLLSYSSKMHLTKVPVTDVISNAWMLFGALFNSLMMLFVLTGFPSYFFHPRGVPMEQQNRAIALSYYTAAPLAWTLLLAPLVGVPYLLWMDGPGKAFPVLLLPILFLMYSLFLVHRLALSTIFRYGRSPHRTSVILPLLWLATTPSISIALAMLNKYIGLVIASLLP